MSVIVFIESKNSAFKKADFEAVSYAKRLADQLEQSCTCLVIGSDVSSARVLGVYGADRVVCIQHEALKAFDGQLYTSAIAQAYSAYEGQVLILLHSSTGKTLAGRLAVKLEAGLVSGANGLPDISQGFVVPKLVFSGKAIAKVELLSDHKIISLMSNTLAPEELGSAVEASSFEPQLAASGLRVIDRSTQTGTVPLPEAERVVSAGRGLKGPENWGIIEELAEVLGATTACSRPVADADWRPHHEHVGQTGIAIRPNLYIAIGISGAIQHLAGVNNSKVIVVINKDPEAPFFKAADYGVCGDLFEVVPRLIQSIKKLKGTH